jgi:hypothetical protein
MSLKGSARAGNDLALNRVPRRAWSVQLRHELGITEPQDIRFVARATNIQHRTQLLEACNLL